MQLAKETLAGQAGLDKLMPTSLRGIARKAKQQKKYRFRNLYGILNHSFLKESWKTVNKNAAPGIDRKTAKEFAVNLDENIRELVERLKKGGYRAKLVRRVEIPKEQDKKGCGILLR